MNKRKRETREWKELFNLERIRTLVQKENYRYLGVLEADIINQTEMKEKSWRKIKKQETFLKAKLRSRNLIKEKDTWGFSLETRNKETYDDA